MSRNSIVPLLAMVLAIGLVTGQALASGPQAQASAAQATQAGTPSTIPSEGPLVDNAAVPADPLPRLLEYHDSGCTRESEGPCSEDDEILLTVEGTTLHVL
ncbi:MAG: hypothetical protein JSV78_15280, partial [Phycisphaerales bacterium]